MKVTVVGQGYVGLPLAIAVARLGHFVYGLDSSEEKIKLLLNGKSQIEDFTDDEIKQALTSNCYIPTSNPKVCKDSDVILICVPTPLSVEHKPDLTFLVNATTTVAENLNTGTLVVIESTIEPGTCRQVILPILLRNSGLSEDQFDLAYSPERIDPTNKEWNIKNTPKLLAGLTQSAVEKAEKFYNGFIDSITLCSTLEVAETAKLLENSFRLINISFINEFAIYCRKAGIDVSEVIKVASTKPYGYMPFNPSLGVGGHCIPVDPIYLANATAKVGVQSSLINLADQINQEMPSFFVEQSEKKVGDLNSKRILVIGVSYKPNVSDVRETPVNALISGLNRRGAQVFWHDDLVGEWKGQKSVALSDDFDLAIIATPHDYLDLTKLGNVPILNTRGSI